MTRCPVSTIATTVVLGIHTAAGQMAHLTLQSQPGDSIGQGQSYDLIYAPGNSSFSAQVWRTLPTGEPAVLVFSLGASPTPALLFFGTDQLGIPIQPGVYTDAQRAAFAAPGHPGLDVSFAHHGCNTVTGNFTITDVSFAAGNSIQTFAARFEQHCEGATPALFGTFTFTAVPEPNMLSLFGCSVTVALVYCVRRKRYQGP